MSLTLKPYEEYRDADLPWLDRIPAHWSVRRAKQVFSAVDVRSETGDEELLTVSSRDGVVPRSQKNVTMFKAESYLGYKLCWPGDLVINSLWAWAGGLGFARHHGIISSAYGVYRPKPTFADATDYLNFALRSPIYDWELHVRSKGIWVSRLQLTDESFFGMPILIPPNNEALAIARFIKSVDTAVRKLIQAKRRVIELLNEQKQAIIEHALTNGSNWQLRRIRTLVHSIDQGVSPQAEAGLADDNSFGVLKAGCVNGGVFREHEHKRLPSGYIFDEAIVVKEGDILVSRACGSPKLVGSVARVKRSKYNLILSDKTFRLNLKDGRLSDFVVAAMNAPYFRAQVEQVISGAEGLANNLPLSSLKDLRIALPPVKEAICIADRLKVDLADTERTLASSHREMELLQEYRTRLIADVVTGKLDVRGVQLPDIDEVEGSDATEEMEAEEELVAAQEGDDGTE